MKVAVGSMNRAKARATKMAFENYFDDLEITPVEVDSGVSKQPLNEDETFEGAYNRAKAAIEAVKKADMGVGIEAGLRRMSAAETKYVETTWCVIIDREGRLTLGSSPQFEYPQYYIDQVLKGKEVSDILTEIFKDPEIKHKQGAIGTFSRKVIDRDRYVSLAVLMALIPRIRDEK